MMKISKLRVQNYRNIKDIDIELDDMVVLLGENNSGKSNLLKAVTLPLLSNEIGFTGKNLSWFDINNNAKEIFYDFIFDNQHEIITDTLEIEIFMNKVPKIVVEITIKPEPMDEYFLRKLSYDENTDIKYGISYEYSPRNIVELLENVKNVLLSEKYEKQNLSMEDIDSLKMNLLPIELYSHSIKVPKRGNSVPYDTLKLYKYTSLIAERDDFSKTTEKLGSNSLVKLLQMKLDTESKITVEKEYTHFFDKLKDLTDMESIFNWQENSEITNAKDYFDEISILPNMPSMHSLLNSVRLGYEGEQLTSQGLGYRNLVLLFVILNSFIEKKSETAFSVITLEEPEAHLSINNQRIMASYMNYFEKQDNSTQLFFSTHSNEFIDKLDLSNIVVMKQGNAISLKTELEDEHHDYLSKNPNLDIYKILFSKKCILVEGLTEELFIKSYFQNKTELNDIEVISFHKGYKKIMDIWLKLNNNTINRLGIVRDNDNQNNAKEEHERYNEHNNICVETTVEYTLEPEIINKGDNYNLLKVYFEKTHNWQINDSIELDKKWRNSKTDVMLRLCKDIASGDLASLELPNHIQNVIDFLNEKI